MADAAFRFLDCNFTPEGQVGGRLCLDFVNTVSSRHETPMPDCLRDYGAFLDWAEAAGAVDAAEAQALREAAVQHRRRAARVHERARGLREQMYRVFRAIMTERSPAEDDLAAINRALAATAARRRLRYAGGRCVAVWASDDGTLARPLWPVVQSAATLLCSDALERVRECPPPHGCGWLFLDVSRNRSRRWCSMRTCGNLAKARRHYQRQQRRQRQRGQ